MTLHAILLLVGQSVSSQCVVTCVLLVLVLVLVHNKLY